MHVISKLWLLLALTVWATATVAQPAPVQLFDGRQAISGKGSQLPQNEVALVKNELQKRASHPVLRRRLDQLNPTFDEFEVRDWADGSFTHKGAKQRAYLYRYSYTNGVVVTEGGKVVAHYSGDPGDYALFIASSKLPDLNGDGRSELVLLCNTEDTADVFAHFFTLGPAQARHLGVSLVFTSNIIPGDDPVPDEDIQDTAFRVTASGSKLTRQRYVKHADGAWKAQGTSEALKLEDPGRLTLFRLDGKN